MCPRIDDPKEQEKYTAMYLEMSVEIARSVRDVFVTMTKDKDRLVPLVGASLGPLGDHSCHSYLLYTAVNSDFRREYSIYRTV